MTAYSESRRVMSIEGEGARDFLQNLVTNDLAGLDAGLVYAALLTPQGKYLADFFVEQRGGVILLDVDATLFDGLLMRLNMYKLRAPLTLSDSGFQVSRGLGDGPEGALSDPRDPALGWRLIADEAMPDDGTDWDALYVSRAIPRTGTELHPDSYILETGFERISGVDFRKGCYVGQEIVARMKHKTELRKGLAIVEVSGEADSGTEITAAGKPVGTLHSRSGNKALAYLRFDRAQGPMDAGDATITLLSPAIAPLD